MSSELYWLGAAGFGLMLGLLWHNYQKLNTGTQSGRSFGQLLLWCIFFCLQDAVWGLCFAGIIPNGNAFFVSTSVFHLASVITAFFWLRYVLDFLGERVKIRRLLLWLGGVLIGLEAALVTANCFQPILFTLADGVYTPTVFRTISFANQYCLYVLLGLLTLFYSSREPEGRRKRFLAVFSFALAPVLLGLLQLAYLDGPFNSLGYLLGCLIIYIFIAEENRESVVAAQEAQLAEISALNGSLQEKQTKLEEVTAEQEAQIEEITALNAQLQDKQTALEASAAAQEAQLAEITALNDRLSEGRARLQQALAMSQETEMAMNRVHEVLGSAPWKVTYNEAGEEVKVELSDGLRRLFGYENAAEFPNSLGFLLSRIYPADSARMLQEVYGALGSKDRTTISSKYRGCRKDGTVQWYLTQGVVQRRADGTPQLAYGVVMDISSLTEAEISHRETLEAFEAVHDALGSGNWQMKFDANGRMTEVLWTDRIRTMLGYQNREDFPDRLSAWTDILHPEDKEKTLQAYWAAVNDRTGKTVYSVRYRLLTRQGVYRWFEAHGSLTRYGDGTPKIFYGLFLDIDDLMMAQQRQDEQLEEITALNTELTEKQNRLEEAAAEQEAQLEEITALNEQMQEKQNRLEEATAEQEAQLEEITALNETMQEEQARVAEAYGMIEGFSQEYHTIWLVSKETLRMRLIRSTGVTTVQSAVQLGKDFPDFDTGFSKYIETNVEPEDRPRMHQAISSKEVLHQLAKGGIYAVNYLRRDDEGHVSYHQIAFANADSADGKKQFVYGFRDIDKLVRAEQEQKQELQHAKEAAESANAAKTSFLFNMSHDIRTPMNAIMGFRDLLEKHQDDPVRRQDYLQKIQDSSAVLLSIINNVLEMARIEKGTLEIEETAWSTEQFNDTLYSVFREMMQAKGLNFTRQIDVQHHYVFCDPTKLREIFINIISNAYKYTNTGSVSMHLEEIPCDREGWVLYRTTIKDTGIGMSEDFLPHLFEEFARENNTTDAKVEGTGLGMPIVKRLVEMLGGSIEVTSQKGVGSTFIVTLPHKIAARANLVEHAGVAIDPKLFQGKHILLVEDNDLNAEIATEILGEAGFSVDRAADGVICLEMLKKAEANYYDVILMDIQMPNMNGYEAARAIRQLPDAARARTKIIAMTANAFEEDRRAALQAGMDSHLAKPIDVNELMRKLAALMG